MPSELVIKNEDKVTYPQAVLQLGREVAAYFDKALVIVNWFQYPPDRTFYVSAENGSVGASSIVFHLDPKGIKAEWNGGIGYGVTLEEALKAASDDSNDRIERMQLGKSA
jgi:hypothetical protein